MKHGEKLEPLFETKIMAVVGDVGREQAQALSQALYEGGIRVIGIPLHSIGAYYRIKELDRQLGKKMLVGACGVLDVKDAKTAKEAGAAFLASPHADKGLMKYAEKERLPIIAGGLTPTEVVQAWRRGAAAVMLFPAAAWGPGYVREVKSVLGHIPLLAAGEIHLNNAADYWQAGCSALAVSQGLFTSRELEESRWDDIRIRAEALLQTGR